MINSTMNVVLGMRCWSTGPNGLDNPCNTIVDSDNVRKGDRRKTGETQGQWKAMKCEGAEGWVCPTPVFQME